MKRLSDDTVEYENDAELVVKEIHDALMDQGYNASDALILMRGSRSPNADTPVLDRILTPDMVDWLTR